MKFVGWFNEACYTMLPMTSEVLINTLAWSFLAVGSGLIACLVWFAMRVVNQLDRLEKLVIGEIHKIDIRLIKLEAWRDGMTGKPAPENRRHSDALADE